MIRFALPALFLVAVPGLAAQSGWRFVQTTDEFTAAGDARLILREDAWPTAPPAAADAYHGATLVIVCGHRLPGADGRTLLLSADQPMEPFGDLAYVEMQFDSLPQITKAYFTMLQSPDVATGRRYTRYVAYLGTERSPYFSAEILAKLLAARRLTLKYRSYGADRSVSFHLTGLREALTKLGDCHWAP